MKAHTKAFILAGYLTLGFALSSCEIEDEYSKPDQSEQLGTKIYKGTNPPAALLGPKIRTKLLWSILTELSQSIRNQKR
jgi:hypothetical protein